MARAGRMLLWTVALVAPGGFLLVPVLAATSLPGKPGQRLSARLGDRAAQLWCSLQRYWTKS